jgi:electron transport complex protein RnfG
MRDIIKLFLVVAIFSAIAGLALAAVRDATADRIELQELTYVRGPAIKSILAGCQNDPLTDRFKIADGKKEISFFIGEFDGKKNVVAFESTGTGFGGDIGIMVGYNLDNDELVGMSVTTSSETAGLGSRAKTDPAFINQFKGMSIKGDFKVKSEGGDIDALSGATVTSRGVCAGIANSIETYKKLKDEILQKIKA